MSIVGCSLLYCVLILALHSWECHATSYANRSRLFEDKLGSSSGYNTAIRPVNDDSQVITVDIKFTIISVVEVNTVSQTFIVNGYLVLAWKDEIVQWNPSDYGGIQIMRPNPIQIWRPRMVLVNTASERDLFEDDYTPLSVASDGQIMWMPGGLFPSTCSLDLTNYPFDYQICDLQFFPMGQSSNEIQFSSTVGKVSMSVYNENGEYEIPNTEILHFNNNSSGMSQFQVKFHLKRRPDFFVINIVMPVVMLSFLNIMVFIIPVDSGEKISYAITVLLALTVFMSIVSGQLPRSSNVTPLITAYLLILTIIAVSTVLVTLVSVKLHHWKEEESKNQSNKALNSFRAISKKIKGLQKILIHGKIFPEEDRKCQDTVETSRSQVRNILDSIRNDIDTDKSNVASKAEHGMQVIVDNWKNYEGAEVKRGDNNNEQIDPDTKTNCWTQIAAWIDIVSFFSFMILWLGVTAIFLGKMAS